MCLQEPSFSWMSRREMPPITVPTEVIFRTGHGELISMVKYYKRLIQHPEVLDEAPAEIVKDMD